jgi:hypothetical protein
MNSSTYRTILLGHTKTKSQNRETDQRIWNSESHVTQDTCITKAFRSNWCTRQLFHRYLNEWLQTGKHLCNEVWSSSTTWSTNPNPFKNSRKVPRMLIHQTPYFDNLPLRHPWSNLGLHYKENGRVRLSTPAINWRLGFCFSITLVFPKCAENQKECRDSYLHVYFSSPLKRWDFKCHPLGWS